MKTTLTTTFFLLSLSIFAQVSDGLIAKYNFNEQLCEDIIGNNDGLSNSVILTEDRFGNQNNAYQFQNNEDSFVDFGDVFDELWSEPDTSFSFSFWFQILDNTVVNVPFISKTDFCNFSHRQFFLRYNINNAIEFVYYNSLPPGNFRAIEAGQIITDSNWHHIVMTYDGSIDNNNGIDRLNFYIDNNLQQSNLRLEEGFQGDIQDGNGHLALGAFLGTSDTSCLETTLDGNIDEMNIYNRILTASDVNILYNAENPISSNHNISQIIEITISPNPVSEFVKLESPIDISKFYYSLNTLSGNTMRIGTIDDKFLDLSLIEKGVYILQIFNAEKELVKIDKLIKL